MVLDEETLEALGFRSQWFVVAGLAETHRIELLGVSPLRRKGTRTESVKCRQCDREFVRNLRGWVKSFCSDACRVKFNNKTATQARGTERPTHCGHCLEPIQQNYGGRVRHFCNESCAKKHKRIKMSEQTLVEKNGYKACICCHVLRPVTGMVETMLHGKAGLQCIDRKWCHDQRENPNKVRSTSWSGKKGPNDP